MSVDINPGLDESVPPELSPLDRAKSILDNYGYQAMRERLERLDKPEGIEKIGWLLEQTSRPDFPEIQTSAHLPEGYQKFSEQEKLDARINLLWALANFVQLWEEKYGKIDVVPTAS